ncbi:hypothetical protein PRUPE_1G226100 [Prunus persica]|uniref:Uncharacterized protein n=1 Tax=Prunus persica TaxID=3760 RepID=A0A251R2T6_PRUPE|nr:hypothetical protein PRUPE_1G226100 [Prunus persica]
MKPSSKSIIYECKTAQGHRTRTTIKETVAHVTYDSLTKGTRIIKCLLPKREWVRSINYPRKFGNGP